MMRMMATMGMLMILATRAGRKSGKQLCEWAASLYHLPPPTPPQSSTDEYPASSTSSAMKCMAVQLFAMKFRAV